MKIICLEWIGDGRNNIIESDTMNTNFNVSRKVLYLPYNGETPIYHFYVRDHLGNNRMVLDESGNIEQVTHYYPYGMSFGEGRGKNIQSYKFNGKELDAKSFPVSFIKWSKWVYRGC